MKELLQNIRDNNILLEVVEGKLQVYAGEDAIDPALLAAIRERKEELLQFLHDNEQPAQQVAYAAPIPLTGVQDSYPLSSAQRRLWLVGQVAAGSQAYHMARAYRLQGMINEQAFEAAFVQLLARHESLRTAFRENEEGEIRQWIQPLSDCGFVFLHRDLSSREDGETVLAAALQQMATLPFDFANGPLIRAGLFRLAAEEWVCCYVMHHIVCDAWSLDIMIRELLECYTAHTEGRQPSLPTARLQYKDYAVWQHELLRAGGDRQHAAYWARQLGGELPVLSLPLDKQRPAVRSYAGGMVQALLDKEHVASLQALLQAEGCTLFMGLLALVNVLLFRHTGQHDIITGSPAAGREHADLEDQVGLYLNALALRTRFEPMEGFVSLLQRVRQVTLEAYEHRYHPFDLLVSELGLQRESGRNALFDVFIDLHEGGVDPGRQIGHLHVGPYEMGAHRVSKFDLTFMFMQSGKELLLSVEYNSDLFERATALRIVQQVNHLLSAIVADPAQPIALLDLLSGEEKDKLVAFGRDTAAAAAWKAPVACIEERVRISPDATALVGNGNTLTYRQLDERATQLAHYLIDSCAIRPNNVVGIMLGRSEYLVIALLAVLKAGAAYVPIDPDYPDSRKAFMMEDTGLQLLLTETNQLFQLAGYTGNLFAMDAQLDTLTTPSTATGVVTQPDDLAYVIYTSGSTGNPKGCCISNSNLSSYIQWAASYYFQYKPIHGFPLFTSLTFDLTVTSIYCTLMLGGTLTIYDQQQHLGDTLQQVFSNTAIDTIKLTPSHINLLKQLPIGSSQLSCAIVGGEELTMDQVDTLKAINPAMRVYNEYGPTEATVGCIVTEVAGPGRILIGKPAAAAQIYILDAYGGLCPVGIPGELYIGGAGLALGYLNNAALTEARFLTNPYTGKGRVYKTGDLAQWLPDGNIRFLGRLDDQVKIRGYRIEPGEIEQVLCRHEAVEAAVVVVKETRPGEKELVAYVVIDDAVTTDNLRGWLTSLLPAWMIPAKWVQLARLPLTSHGKVDKKQLPAPDEIADGARNPYTAPRSDQERAMVALWQEVLGRAPIGIDDDFFALGGDSIKAITLVVHARKQLGMKISVHELYEHPTVQSLTESLAVPDLTNAPNTVEEYLQAGHAAIAAFAAGIEEEDLTKKILPAVYEDIYPVVPIEQGMIFSSLLNPAEPVYYDQFSFIIRIDDVDRFLEGLHRLVQRHAILRTRYFMSSFSRPAKVVLPALELPLTYEDLSALTTGEKTVRVQDYVRMDLDKRLRFDNELLWRINLFRLEGDRHYITYSFHHAMLDGWSVSVFKTEIANYTGGEPAPLKHSYKDYCAITLGRQTGSATASYWKNLLQGYTRNKLPFNYKGTRISDATGMLKVQRPVSRELLLQLTALSEQQQVSFKAICLAAHICLLHIICAEQDVVTGVVTHERPEIEDGENMLGCFLTTIPVRIDLGKCTDLLSLVKQVNEYLITVKAHEVHLSDIARFIGDKTSVGNPVFDTILNYTDFHRFEDVGEDALINILEAGEKVSDLEVAHEMTNTLFDVEVGKTLDRFTARIKYAPAYFETEAVAYALELYIRILGAFAQQVHTPLVALDLLTADERTSLLTTFNDTEQPYEQAMTLDKLFERQVALTPGAVALRQDGVGLTYQAVNEEANRLAACLLAKGVQGGDNIGIHASRSFSMIIGMYGILKAGAAYVPIDPDYPADRQEYIARNSAVKLVVSDATTFATAAFDGIDMLLMSQEALADFHPGNPGILHSSRELAYTIYTSGSTGRPKGVMIEHHAAVNLVDWVNKTFQVGPEDRMLFITSMCFDLSVYDIFGILSAGGTVVIARQEEVQQIGRLKQLLLEERITFWDSVPSTMHYLVGELAAANDPFRQNDLRLVFLSGDWIPVKLPDQIRAYFPAASVISLGGATEGTVWSNYYPIETVLPSWASIPYGRPIWNNSFYILNDHGQPVPKGVVGELYIGGVGVARGYANDPEKSAAAFKPDPFNDRLGGVMYKTGDLGRFLPDGNMQFLGRKDNQVKIRGFRVELGEIESVLQKHEQLKGAIVHVYQDGNNMNQLCGYLLRSDEPDIPAIKDYLKNSLPAYMVPAHFLLVEAFPLNSNGKIDRKALPRPTENESLLLSTYLGPVTQLQVQIEKIWASILNVNRIGIRDDLFELGANSLSVGAFVNRLQRELDVTVNMRNVFVAPTIEAIAGEVEKIRWANGELFDADAIANTETFSI
ncbi:non-ribosomal peptide synthetase [Paraflavitalea pollutisoli]|uniref:non-ribosomal peptide synthetase n=1 Tax=Paraflavitalea pollutisoli TaxID=3034143 RepID=UPI0023ECBF8A|nr:non-ribosomal peptide synthetase [Paraflavitalea sp. H1-2-19X]